MQHLNTDKEKLAESALQTDFKVGPSLLVHTVLWIRTWSLVLTGADKSDMRNLKGLMKAQ